MKFARNFDNITCIIQRKTNNSTKNIYTSNMNKCLKKKNEKYSLLCNTQYHNSLRILITKQRYAERQRKNKQTNEYK